MDLRITKTNQAIKDAFLSLRAKTDLEKIKVKDICSIAAINKSTFYKYYQDIYALSDKLEHDTIMLFLSTFTAKDALFTDPYRFIMEFPVSLAFHKKLLTTLYRDRIPEFTEQLTKALIEYYQPENYTISGEMQLSFILNGTFQTMLEMKEKYSTECIAKHLADVIKNATSAPYITEISDGSSQ